MYTRKQYSLAVALFAMVLGLLASLLSPSLESLGEEPLSTNAAMLAPKNIPTVDVPPPDMGPNYLPDSRRTIPWSAPTTTSVNPPAVVTPPPMIRKPKPPVERAQHAPAPPAHTANSATEKAVQAALSKQGRPYVWGATGPNQFDCSGLVQWAFKQAGISLPRTTKTIISRGKAVSRNAMQRGDLVWTSSGHMGIYLGDNKMIHAPQTGDVVKVQTVWAFYAARRI